MAVESRQNSDAVHALSANSLCRSGSGVRVLHGFFTRAGGVSKGLYASLNCGLGSGDDRLAVNENRARATAKLGLDGNRLITLNQTHSARVAVIDTAPVFLI